MTSITLEPHRETALVLLEGPAGKAAGKWKRILRAAAVGFLSILVSLGLWQTASQNKVNFFFRFENVPPPTEVAKAAGHLFQAPNLRRMCLTASAGFSWDS